MPDLLEAPSGIDMAAAAGACGPTELCLLTVLVSVVLSLCWFTQDSHRRLEMESDFPALDELLDSFAFASSLGTGLGAAATAGGRQHAWARRARVAAVAGPEIRGRAKRVTFPRPTNVAVMR